MMHCTGCRIPNDSARCRGAWNHSKRRWYPCECHGDLPSQHSTHPIPSSTSTATLQTVSESPVVDFNEPREHRASPQVFKPENMEKEVDLDGGWDSIEA